MQSSKSSVFFFFFLIKLIYSVSTFFVKMLVSFHDGSWFHIIPTILFSLVMIAVIMRIHLYLKRLMRWSLIYILCSNSKGSNGSPFMLIPAALWSSSSQWNPGWDDGTWSWDGIWYWDEMLGWDVIIEWGEMYLAAKHNVQCLWHDVWSLLFPFNY